MKHRNCHLAMHLAGNRGAGEHVSSYARLRHEPAPDTGDLADDELQERILAV